MPDIVAIDPGMTTGVVCGRYTPDTPLEITRQYEVEGGLDGLHDFLETFIKRNDFPHKAVCEKFRTVPRVYRADEVEALRIEGLVTSWWPSRTWQYNDQLLIGGAHGSRSLNKRLADDILRKMGLWSLPSEFPEHGDAADVNAAKKHLIAYLRNHDHRPTLQALEAYVVN